MKSPSAGPALTLAWTCGSLKHFISAPLAICAPLKGSSLSFCERGRKGAACTFLTQLAGPYFPDAPLSPLAPLPPFICSLFLSCSECSSLSVSIAHSF